MRGDPYITHTPVELRFRSFRLGALGGAQVASFGAEGSAVEAMLSARPEAAEAALALSRSAEVLYIYIYIYIHIHTHAHTHINPTAHRDNSRWPMGSDGVYPPG